MSFHPYYASRDAPEAQWLQSKHTSKIHLLEEEP